MVLLLSPIVLWSVSETGQSFKEKNVFKNSKPHLLLEIISGYYKNAC